MRRKRKGSRRIKILDRFIIKELKTPFFFGIFAFSLLLVAGDLLFDLADLFVESGVPLWIVIKLFIYRLPGVVVLTLPMAMLLTSIYCFSKLSSQSELIALKASGIAFQRIVRPLLAVSLVVGCVALLLNETIVPLADKAAEHVFRYEIARQRPSLLKERLFLREEKEGRLSRVIYIEKLLPRSGLMEGVLVQEFNEGSLKRIMMADKGNWQDGEWWLESGRAFEIASDGQLSGSVQFARQRLPLPLSPAQIERAAADPKRMSALELYKYIALVEAQGADVRPLQMLLHLRLAVPWAGVVLAMVGSSMGVRSRRTSSGVGLGVSVIVIFFYYVLMSLCKAMGENGYMLPLLAAWLPNILFFLIGGMLIRRANRT